jgi:hypothetical protein
VLTKNKLVLILIETRVILLPGVGVKKGGTNLVTPQFCVILIIFGVIPDNTNIIQE